MIPNALPPPPPNPDDVRSLAALHQYYQALRPSPARRLLQFGRDFVFFVPVLAAILFALEFVNEPDHKPSTLIGNWLGSEEAAKLRNQLEMTQQTLAAQNRENEKLQEAVERFKMDLGKVQGAYQASYQRINDMAKVMAEIQAKSFEMQQQLSAKMEGGKASTAVFLDMTAPFLKMAGMDQQAQTASDTAAHLKEEARRELRGQAVRNIADAQANMGQWLAGLPRPEDIIRQDREKPLRPAPYAAPPAKHPFYAAKKKPAAQQAERH